MTTSQIASSDSSWDVPPLLRGESAVLAGWLMEPAARRMLWQVGIIALGAGVYGAVIGYWRSPLQGLFSAIKFPLILLFTGLGNALINAMLAPLLGLKIGFQQSFLAILMSFTIIAAILGSCAPIVFFMVWNVPPFQSGMTGVPAAYTAILLSQVFFIAFAGITGNVRLFQLLQTLSGSRLVAFKVLFAWLGVNLILGAQLTWIMRPFFGSPHLEVQFLRPNALEGNFFESVYHSLIYLLAS